MDIVFKTAFSNASGKAVSQPFISSFCSHVGDADYERENGLLSQWRGYGSDGGFCLVFDTKGLLKLLEAEFESRYWLHLSIGAVHYDFPDRDLSSQFPELIEDFYRMCEALFDHADLGDVDALFKDVLVIASRFKHQAFHEEREVRIVAARPRDGLRVQASAAGRELAAVNEREGSKSKYVVLFERAGLALPIKRVIVGPSSHQNEAAELARELLGSGIPVHLSKTPYIGAPT